MAGLRRGRALTGLRARLIALTALAMALSLAGLALFSRQVVTSEFERFVRRQPAASLGAAGAAVSRWHAGRAGWAGADSLLAGLAPATGRALVLLDPAGQTLAASSPRLRAARLLWRADGTLEITGGGARGERLQLELHGPETCTLRVDGRPVAQLVALPAPAGDAPPFLHAVDRRLGVGLALALALGLALAWVVAGRIVRPLDELAGAARRVAAGDLAARVAVRGDDEVAALGRRFNAMAESLAAQARERRQLTADVAHELRTPLAHLLAQVEAMEDGLVAVDPRALALLHDEVLQLTRLVEDLEQLAHADQGTLALELADVPAEEALRAAVAAVQAALDARSLTARVDVTGQPVARADRRRLAQVLRNLLDNALAHSPPGSVITLAARARGPAVHLLVSDQGEGIAPEHQARVFERFYRADPSRSRATGGTGLGLAIVKRLVEAQAGHVELDSAPGRGTTVTVVLPAAPGSAG